MENKELGIGIVLSFGVWVLGFGFCEALRPRLNIVIA